MLAAADLTATATLVLAGITLCLMLATVGLVIATGKLVTSTRESAKQAREDARSERQLLERQLQATYRPLLVDVLERGDITPDMGASESTMIDERGMTIFLGPPRLDVELPGMGVRSIDPRDVFVLFENGKVFVSVPLRNVGRGLAVIVGEEVALRGTALGAIEHMSVRRYHVPVGETTRVELTMGYRMQEQISAPGEIWSLKVPYHDFAGDQYSEVLLQIVCRGDDAAKGLWGVGRVEQD